MTNTSCPNWRSTSEQQFRAQKPRGLHFWRGGRLLHQPGSRILREAREAGWTLLTYDLATTPALLVEMSQRGEDHHGVIFVSAKSFAQNDHGSLLRALAVQWPVWSECDWSNRTEFQRRAG